MSQDRHDVALPVDPATGLEHLGTLAEAWGATWQQRGVAGGRLDLPVRAGVRRGLVEGEISVQRTADGCQIRYDIHDSFYRVQYSVFFLLLLGAIGGLLTMLVPFAPGLLPLLPVGVILAVAAWLLIASRLHNSGPEEFFAVLEAETALAEESPSP